MRPSRGDRLLARIRANVGRPKKQAIATLALLDEVFKGYPLEKIRAMLRDDDFSVVESGVWIIGELLPKQAIPMMDDIVALLRHPHGPVRAEAVRCVHGNATSEHGAAIAQALALVDDPDQEVRASVLTFLGFTQVERLQAGRGHGAGARSDELIGWLASLRLDSFDPELVIERLASSDRTVRVFAAAAAARMWQADPSLLDRAASSSDEEISRYATTERELAPMHAQMRSKWLGG